MNFEGEAKTRIPFAALCDIIASVIVFGVAQ